MNTGIIDGALAAVIVAGGGGERFGQGDKLLAPLRGVPVIVHSLRKFAQFCPDGQIAVALRPETAATVRELVGRHLPGHAFLYVEGGRTRAESALNALEALPDTALLVAVHDAARPLVSPAMIGRCFAVCRERGAAVLARRATDTIKTVRGPELQVGATIDRAAAWQVETPQVFPRLPLLAAYRAALAAGAALTDDAGAMERAGHPVFLVEDPLPNLKLTFPHDLALAEALLALAQELSPATSPAGPRPRGRAR